MSREAALEFYERLESDRTLQEQLEALGDPERIARHVREELGYRFTREEMRQVICERNRDLSDEELEAVVGGTEGAEIPGRTFLNLLYAVG